MKREELEKLATEKSSLCITISINTHRTHPENLEDIIQLKNLLNEAEERILKEFGNPQGYSVIEKIGDIEKEIDVNYNLESLHIFLSDSTKEIVKSIWPTKNCVHIADHFTVKPLIKDINRMEEYLILVLSQSGVQLFHAINDNIAGEIKNADFPFAKNPHILTDHDKLSDGKKVDNMVREFFNTIDKAVVRVYNKTGMNAIVICTDNNWSRLKQVADIPSIYHGHVRLNYNDKELHKIITDAWLIENTLQKQSRTEAIQEMQEAVGQGKVVTDLSEIFRAVKEGRGDLLIAHDDFHQAVRMTGEFSFDLVNDVTLPGVIDDIASDIAWEVISKKGRTIYTDQEEIKSLGGIALKVRY